MSHATCRVKVNTWVDKGIAPLVEALNLRGDVMTLDSCEGGDDREAYVMFIAVGAGLTVVVCEITDQLSGLARHGVPIQIRLDFNLAEGTEIAELILPAADVSRVADALSVSGAPTV